MVKHTVQIGCWHLPESRHLWIEKCRYKYIHSNTEVRSISNEFATKYPFFCPRPELGSSSEPGLKFAPTWPPLLSVNHCLGTNNSWHVLGITIRQELPHLFFTTPWETDIVYRDEETEAQRNSETCSISSSCFQTIVSNNDGFNPWYTTSRKLPLQWKYVLSVRSISSWRICIV